MMVVYVPSYGVFSRTYFDGCFLDRPGEACSSWVAPGTWPAWAL
jgi:hypothetical protein